MHESWELGGPSTSHSTSRLLDGCEQQPDIDPILKPDKRADPDIGTDEHTVSFADRISYGKCSSLMQPSNPAAVAFLAGGTDGSAIFLANIRTCHTWDTHR